MDPNPDRRTSPRRRVLKTAYIVISDKAPKLECVVRNVSAKGARLEVATTFGIPETFRAIINGVPHSCRTVWRTDKILGVQFE